MGAELDQGTHWEVAALRRGRNESGRVRGGAGQGSVARGLAGKTGHGWWRQCRELGMDRH